MLANQDIKYVVCAHTSASVLSVRAKSEIVCTDTEEHFTIQSDSICVQHVDSVLYTRGQHSESVTESVLANLAKCFFALGEFEKSRPSWHYGVPILGY